MQDKPEPLFPPPSSGPDKRSFGIWPNLDSFPGRLQNEMPPALYQFLSSITQQMVDQYHLQSPVVVELGAGSGFETQELINLLHPHTKIITVDADASQIGKLLTLRDRLAISPAKLVIVHKNGWDVLTDLEKFQPNSAGNIAVILAANSLGIAANQMDQTLATLSINNLLDQAKKLLHPSGIILLTAGTSGLMITRDDSAEGQAEFVLRPGNWIEAEFLRPEDAGSFRICRSFFGKDGLTCLKKDQMLICQAVYLLSIDH